MPVAARSKAWVYGHSIAGNTDSNPTGGMDVCVYCECCVPSCKAVFLNRRTAARYRALASILLEFVILVS